ncbi:MAG: hypothetical protein PHS38_10735 [Bacteroidales bacterium]|nr:hypothetical protein [Bacteroidales bacterium]
MAFEGNFYDGHTLADHLEQIQRITGHRPKIALIDRGYRGEKYVENTKIEPVIGHLKKDHRMLRNYLKGTRGDAINTMMVVPDYNLRHWIIKREKELLFVLFNIIEKWNMVVSLLRSKYRWLAAYSPEC